MGFGVDLEVVEVESKERNGRNDKKELKNYVFPFRMNMRKICTVVRNETKRILAAAQKGKMETDFTWPCENFAQSCEMFQEGENGANEFSTSHNRAKLLELVWNCTFSRFLGE